jgi:hypothetical protein
MSGGCGADTVTSVTGLSGDAALDRWRRSSNGPLSSHCGFVAPGREEVPIKLVFLTSGKSRRPPYPDPWLIAANLVAARSGLLLGKADLAFVQGNAIYECALRRDE